MSEISDAIQAMQEGILLAIDKKISEASFDKTYTGRIVSVISETKYKVLINGIEYTAKSNALFKLNDVVTIIVPQNNYSNMLIVPYGITSDMTIPANGGNADTVNYHTVNSDVPSNLQYILDKAVLFGGGKNTTSI